MRAFLVAEVGSTHGGDLVRMLELVDLVAAVGFDMYKAQWSSDADLLARRRRVVDEDAYAALRWPEYWHRVVAGRCHLRGLEYGCSAYLPGDVAIVADRVDFVKVSSFEAADPAMRDALLEQDVLHRTIVSTGMMSALEIRDRPWLRDTRAVLHCVSAYPVPLDQADLRGVSRLRSLLEPDRRALIGYSDHTRDVRTGALAVAAGAEVVEVHVAHPRCYQNHPDRAVSLDLGGPGTWAGAVSYVSFLREAEAMLGDYGTARPPCEAAMRPHRVG